MEQYMHVGSFACFPHSLFFLSRVLDVDLVETLLRQQKNGGEGIYIAPMVTNLHDIKTLTVRNKSLVEYGRLLINSQIRKVNATKYRPRTRALRAIERKQLDHMHTP